jgi:simple sugar transport system ATP-binding protein
VEEVLEISDEVTILRKGETVGTGETKKLDKKQIVQMIVGAPFPFEIKHCKHEAKEVLLSIKDLHIKKGDIETVKGVSFDVRAGEIVAIAGVSGNGQQEIVEAIFGLRNYSDGQILVESKNIGGLSPRERRKIGINYIPEDRLNVGSCMDASIMENLIIDKYYERSFSNNGCLNINKLEQFSKKLVNKYEIKTPNINNYVRNLSGGNIQRVIIAREIKPETKILIACEPAMGLDIRSVKYVYDVLLNLREAQKAILLLASDLDEIISLVDRIIVMYKGKITAYMNNPELFDKKEIGEYMLGIKT